MAVCVALISIQRRLRFLIRHRTLEPTENGPLLRKQKREAAVTALNSAQNNPIDTQEELGREKNWFLTSAGHWKSLWLLRTERRVESCPSSATASLSGVCVCYLLQNTKKLQIFWRGFTSAFRTPVHRLFGSISFRKSVRNRTIPQINAMTKLHQHLSSTCPQTSLLKHIWAVHL